MKLKKYALVAALLPLCLLLNYRANADVRLPGFFSDNMVFQQGMPIQIWGWGDVGEPVIVQLGPSKVQTTTNDQGRWKVALPEMKASKEAVRLSVKGKNSIQLNDILIGEVWLCSGQSNMEWSVARSGNAEQEIASANYPMIRHMKIKRTPSNIALQDAETKWEVCTPETAAEFTATGYYMARQLYKELNVPIGLVNSSWGGTKVEPWTPPVGFASVPALKKIHSEVLAKTPNTKSYNQILGKHIAAVDSWLKSAKKSLGTTTPVSPSPVFPDVIKPYTSHQSPTMLYNGMIHPLVGFSIRGAIWYQGESNHTDGMMYFKKKKALIQGWRELWGQGDFPFYFVQIAPFQYGNENPTILAKFWEAQEKVTELPNVKMVVINDIATVDNIHPPNKQDVGLRLANLALKYDYGKTELIADSPRFESVKTSGNQLIIQFSGTGGGLKTSDGNPPSHFELIGPNSGGFHPANAAIEGDKVVLTSELVVAPTAFRFAWNKTAEPNLTGSTGLPVGAVRGGKV
ncbi:MAG: sialate O-acetylesterase, partial [Planctomycetota bacterium]